MSSCMAEIAEALGYFHSIRLIRHLKRGCLSLPEYRLSQALRDLERVVTSDNVAKLRGDLVEAFNRFLESRNLRRRGVDIVPDYRLVRGIPDAGVGAIFVRSSCYQHKAPGSGRRCSLPPMCPGISI